MTLLDLQRPTLRLHSQSDADRLRVLVSAYAVSPARGSEPGLGWNLVSRLAKHHDVTVLCSTGVPGPDGQNFHGEIERHLVKHGLIDGLRFAFVPTPPLSRLLQRETPILRRTLYYAGYAAWQRAAYRLAKQLHERKPFDVVHHLNITGYREPGYLWKLDAPFVWGPVGGAADIPEAFLPEMSGQDRFFYRARNFFNGVQKRFLVRPGKAAKTARHIWAIGEENRKMVADVWGRDAENLIESGAALSETARVRELTGDRPLKLVWSGQHIGRKALPILLHAMTKVGAKLELTVLGDGAESQRWKETADELGITTKVFWTGLLTQCQALEKMSEADALVLTSVQEGTPHVVLEALSLGMPVICHNACGMGVAVDETCGLKVEMTDFAHSVNGFAAAIARLATGGTLLTRLSRGAIDRAQMLSWDAKAAHIARQYRTVVAHVTGEAR